MKVSGSSKSQLMLVGTNHKYAPIELRERLSCPTDELPSRLKAFVNGNSLVKEAVLLSTCNRTELYFTAASDFEASAASEGFTTSSSVSLRFIRELEDYAVRVMADWAGISSSNLKEHFYCLIGEDAVRHVFEVASGFDSLVFGEQQIKSQTRDAARAGTRAGTAGRFLIELFNHACYVADQVQMKCDLGHADASVASASISLLNKASKDNPIRSMLLLGAGKMIKLAVGGLSSLNLTEIWVMNRTTERAEELAKRVGGYVLPFNKMSESLEKTDAVLICTSSPSYVIKFDDLESAIRKRNGRPIIIVDASVPRNVDPSAATIPGVKLYNIDDLAPFVEIDGKLSKARTEEGRKLIQVEVNDWCAHIEAYNANDTLKNLRKVAEEIREKELSRALRKLGSVSERERAIVDLLTRRIVNKLLYEPTARLKERTGHGDGEAYDEAIRELFGLEQETRP